MWAKMRIHSSPLADAIPRCCRLALFRFFLHHSYNVSTFFNAILIFSSCSLKFSCMTILGTLILSETDFPV